ncbi:MAG TPA: c-type cytochrome [Terriglobia bacterium]|nr:c-type cytochrome [Terriglobia bacterium]
MKKFILGLILGLILVPAGAVFYFVSGMAPAATADPPMPFEKLIAGASLHARITKEMPTSSPVQANEATYLAGADVYRMDCAMCHGLPKQPVPDIAKGMFPKPPQLFQPHHDVADDPAGMTFWKVKNGIRLTGMPSFGASLSDQQMWQVSELLANGDKLPASVHQALAPPPSSAPATK